MSEKPPGKLRQIGQMVSLTAKADPKYVPVVTAAVVVTAVAVFALFTWLLNPIVGTILAILAATIAFTSITGRRGQSAAFSQIEGQPGAAAAVLNALRGDWRVKPMVAFNKQQDLVHRAIGRAGVILVAEGSGGGRTRELLSGELKKVRRVIGPDAPLHDIVVGDGEGQVPLKRLTMHIMKLPRTMKPREVNAVESRLKALDGTGVPLPKGPMPTRMPRSGKMR
jgi:hypothetical protein